VQGFDEKLRPFFSMVESLFKGPDADLGDWPGLVE
jgi:hypothetical protein